MSTEKAAPTDILRCDAVKYINGFLITCIINSTKMLEGTLEGSFVAGDVISRINYLLDQDKVEG